MNFKIKNAFLGAFLKENKIICDYIIMITKCLIDDKSNNLVYIDYNRLSDEWLYYRYYGKAYGGFNLNIILPIILSNTSYENSKQEILKFLEFYCEYYKLNQNKNEYIINAVLYNRLIHLLISNPKAEHQTLINALRDNLMEMNLSSSVSREDIIDFQRCKIKILNKKCSLDLFSLLDQVYLKDAETSSEEEENLKNSVLGLLELNLDFENIPNAQFIRSMSEYIIKLREFKVNKKVYMNNGNPTELIKFEVGQITEDAILGRARIEKKHFIDNILSIQVSCKSGEYNFKFKSK